MRRLLFILLILTAAPPAIACRGQVPERDLGVRTPAVVDSTFVRLVHALSEPGGYFDTDNLISNEASYLHVLGPIRERGVRGGVYVGVGPDQNFSYIAELQPDLAFIIDIRRDNLLQHLWFKALFELAETRVQYLALMFGKPTPAGRSWSERTIEELVDYLDTTPTRSDVVEANQRAVRDRVMRFGLSLSGDDLDAIARIHGTFVSAGPDLRFTSHNRPPRAYYPTYRQLVLERDLEGRQSGYLASEDRFRVVKALQDRNRIIPVVGDLSGDHALRAIGRYLTEVGTRISAMYVSNVEFYLMRNGTFSQFAGNVGQLPYDENSLIIRSYFGGWYRRQHPQAVPGYFSSQLLQTFESFLRGQTNGGYVSYFDLVTRNSLDLR